MIRNLCTLLLALTLAATSVSAAVIHAEMQAATEMAICADTPSGLGTLTGDATGKPITSAHRCFDVNAALTALLPGLTQLEPHNIVTTPPQPLPARDSTSISTPAQFARDPPPFA